MENPDVRDTALIRPGLVLHIPERGEAPSRPPVQYARAEADLPPPVISEPAHTRAPTRVATNQSDEVQTQRVHFTSGSNSATIEDSISGYEIIDYVLRAQRGQSINVSMATQNNSNYFNVLPPNGNGYALFNGSVSGDTFESVLPETGDYTVRVYLMRAAARRGEKADYRLEMTIDTPAADTGSANGDTSAAQRAGSGNYDATGSMPCAQVAGQPLQNCQFGVSREGSGSATVVVTRPDGSTRALFFIHGRFNSADTSQADGYPEYSATRSSDVTIVRVGEEIYQVDDAVLFGG